MARKRVLSIRLDDEQVKDLQRTARRLGRTPSQAAAMLVDEGLRRERFPLIEMRDTAAGRTAYIKGHRLPVWLMSHRMWHGESPEEVAGDLRVPADAMRQALAYAEQFRGEIEAIFAWNDEFDRDPERFIPGIQIFRRR